MASSHFLDGLLVRSIDDDGVELVAGLVAADALGHAGNVEARVLLRLEHVQGLVVVVVGAQRKGRRVVVPEVHPEHVVPLPGMEGGQLNEGVPIGVESIDQLVRVDTHSPRYICRNQGVSTTSGRAAFSSAISPAHCSAM